MHMLMHMHMHTHRTRARTASKKSSKSGQPTGEQRPSSGGGGRQTIGCQMMRHCAVGVIDRGSWMRPPTSPPQAADYLLWDAVIAALRARLQCLFAPPARAGARLMGPAAGRLKEASEQAERPPQWRAKASLKFNIHKFDSCCSALPSSPLPWLHEAGREKILEACRRH